MRYRLVHGAPASAPQPLTWAKRQGLPTSKARWEREAGCPAGGVVCRARRLARHQPYRGVVELALRMEGIALGRKLGCGSFGCAYTRRDYPDQVVKITGDPSEVAAAQRVIEARKRGCRLSSVVRFYRTFAVADSDLYVVIQERLLPLKPNEYRLLEDQGDLLYKIGTLGSNRDQQRAAKLLGKDYGIPWNSLYDLLRVFDQLSQVGVEWHDLHEGNVLRSASGRLKVIDLGISRSGGIKVREV